MVHTVATWLSYQIAGVPVGAWLALAALAEIQDRLRTSRWKSNTIVQLLLNGTVGRLLSRYPAAREAAAPVAASDTAPTAPTRPPSDHLAILLIACALALSGCGHGSDDLRRACGTEERAVAGGYATASAWYRGKIATDDHAQLVKDTATFDKAVNGLDAVAAGAKTQCALADAIDAGQKHDVKSLIASVLAAVIQVGEILKGVL